MKALTLWRPWPAAIIHSTKRVENRTWVPPPWLLGKDFALHAGKTVDKDTVEDLISAAMNMDPVGVNPDLLPGPTGIVAVVRLAGYVAEANGRRVRMGIDEALARQIVESPWYGGPAGWVLDNIRPLFEPVECKGAQGLWNVPPDIADAVLARLGKAIA